MKERASSVWLRRISSAERQGRTMSAPNCKAGPRPPKGKVGPRPPCAAGPCLPVRQYQRMLHRILFQANQLAAQTQAY
eukprot:2227475-Pleurochrysis_carterae.AAC.2